MPKNVEIHVYCDNNLVGGETMKKKEAMKRKMKTKKRFFFVCDSKSFVRFIKRFFFVSNPFKWKSFSTILDWTMLYGS